MSEAKLDYMRRVTGIVKKVKKAKKAKEMRKKQKKGKRLRRRKKKPNSGTKTLPRISKPRNLRKKYMPCLIFTLRCFLLLKSLSMEDQLGMKQLSLPVSQELTQFLVELTCFLRPVLVAYL